MEFVLDTDIGTDVDDLLALAVVLGSPELSVSAVTTVYGDVALRARLVAHAFAVAGVDAPPILPGLGQTRSGRAVWWAGHEGKNLPSSVPMPDAGGLDAIEVLARSSVVAAIAPLTNVAAAVERSDRQIEQIVMMAGEFSAGTVEHNIRCDIAAAEVVFSSGVPILAVGLDQTQRLEITEATLERTGGSPLGDLIESEVRAFWAFIGKDANHPHDPMALMALARPELFEVRSGRIHLQPAGESAGRTTFEPGAGGPHQIVVGFDTEAVADAIVSRIERAGALSAQPSPKETAQ